MNTARFAASQLQTFKGLRGRHFVHEMSVNIEKDGTVWFGAHDVRLPNLLEHGLGSHKALL
jgi:hypothetical protein